MENVSRPEPSKDVKGQKGAVPTVQPGDLEQFINATQKLEQLQQILNYVQSLRDEQYAKARKKAASLALDTSMLATEGSAEEQGNIAAYNTLQGHLSTQVQSLVQQIKTLRLGNRSLTAQLDPMLTQLKTIATKFPNLTENDINSLNTMTETLVGCARQCDTRTQQAFWGHVNTMFEKIYSDNAQAVATLEQKAAECAGSDPEAAEGAKKAAGMLGAAQKPLGQSAAAGAASGVGSGSLPSDFANAILHKYMPEQQQYLMELAFMLSFDNMGAGIGNALLNKITGFSGAGNSFDFSNDLNSKSTSTKNQFSGSVTQAQNQLSTETSNAQHTINQLNSSINYIQQEEKTIEGNSQLTDSQKAQLISKLNSISENMKVALTQANQLYSMLKNMTIEPGSKTGTFKVVSTDGDWQKDLSTDENELINGNSSGTPAGGLVSISSQVTTFQQNYADQSQNQQMMLQMRMTEIQQEWTTVSTAIQLLNQMYMTIAQGIYH